MELGIFIKERRLNIDPNSRTLGEYVRLQSRLGRPVTQEEIAEYIGVSRAWYAMLETQSRVRASPPLLDRLARALMLNSQERTLLFNLALPELKLEGQSPQTDLIEAQRSNLPPHLTSFIGREAVVAEIKELVRAHRLVTLVGAGGVGKSRCAMKAGEELIAEFADGAWLVELSALEDSSLIAATFAQALSVQSSPTRPVLDSLLAYLRRKRLLLIVDNCEHVVEAAGRIVAELLHRCPSVRILTTSRQSLGITGEWVYRVPSLSVTSGARLFTDRALSVDNRFSLNDESARHIEQVCQRLDGIPLAIELAAARVKTLSPRELAQRLDDRFRILTGGDRTALPRHQTMRALIDWSYDLLTEDERRMFRRLAVFAGGFTLDSVCDVCGDDSSDEISTVDLLESLVDKSLVHVERLEGATRYWLLESTRQYARDRLTEADEYDAVARAHAAAYVKLAIDLQGPRGTLSDREWLAKKDSELQNFRAALNWALLGNGDVLLGQRLVAAMKPVWTTLIPSEGHYWVHNARRLADASTPASVVADLDFIEADLFAWNLEHEAAYISANRALSRYIELGDEEAIIRMQLIVGASLATMDKAEQGYAVLEEALGRSRTAGIRHLIARTLLATAFARLIVGDVPEARPLLTEAMAQFRAAGMERGVAVVAMSLSEVEFRSGNVTEALRIMNETVPTFRALHDPLNVARAKRIITAYLIALERYEEGTRSARETLADARSAGSDLEVALTAQHLAAIAALRPSTGTENDARTRAAHLLGWVDAQLSYINGARQDLEQKEYDRVRLALLNALNAQTVADLLREGSAWSEDLAVAEAMLIA